MINSIVDKVFVITTVNSNRVDYIKKHLTDNNITFDFFVAVDTKIVTDTILVNDGGDLNTKNHKALLSLISAFVSIVETAKLQNFKSVCVIEDDCFFGQNWREKLKSFIEKLPHEWDLLNIGYHPLHDTDTIKIKYNDFVNIPLNWHHTTHCMIIKNTCYDEIINQVNKWNYTLPIDYIFNEIYKNKNVKAYIPSDKFIYQVSVRDSEYYIPGNPIRFKSTL